MKRILITGSRDWEDDRVIGQWLSYYSHYLPKPADLVVVHGACPSGADSMADLWASRLGLTVERHPAQWRQYGIYNPQAGKARNREMVLLGADLCLAFIRNGSRGATHCAALAEEAGIPIVRFTA